MSDNSLILLLAKNQTKPGVSFAELIEANFDKKEQEVAKKASKEEKRIEKQMNKYRLSLTFEV